MSTLPFVTYLDDALRLERLHDGIILVRGDITNSTAGEFLEQLHFVMKRPRIAPLDGLITIEIMSPGGDAYPSIAMYDAIAHCGRDTIGITLGYACSAAGMIVLQACTKRLSLPRTRFLLHEVKELGGFDEKTVSENEDNLKELQMVQKMVIEILAQRLGKPPAEVGKLIERREYWLGAEEAKSLGLIDDIVIRWGPAKGVY